MKYTPEECSCCIKNGRGKGNYELNGVRFACDCHNVITYHINHFPVYASAPALLEALKRIANNEYGRGYGPKQIAEQAIAKAENKKD